MVSMTSRKAVHCLKTKCLYGCQKPKSAKQNWSITVTLSFKLFKKISEICNWLDQTIFLLNKLAGDQTYELPSLPIFKNSVYKKATTAGHINSLIIIVLYTIHKMLQKHYDRMATKYKKKLHELSRVLKLLFHRLLQQKVIVIMTFIKGHSIKQVTPTLWAYQKCTRLFISSKK